MTTLNSGTRVPFRRRSKAARSTRATGGSCDSLTPIAIEAKTATAHDDDGHAADEIRRVEPCEAYFDVKHHNQHALCSGGGGDGANGPPCGLPWPTRASEVDFASSIGRPQKGKFLRLAGLRLIFAGLESSRREQSIGTLITLWLLRVARRHGAR